MPSTNKHVFSPFLLPTQFCPLWPNPRREIRGIHSLDLEGFDRPILLGVVQNGPIRAKLAHSGASGNALLQPRALIQIRLINQLERVDVGLEVFREEVVVVVTNGVQQPISDAVPG